MPRRSMQVTISLPPDLYRRAAAVARGELRSRSDLVRKALREYVIRRTRVSAARDVLGRALRRKGIQGIAGLERMIDGVRT